MTKQDSRSLKDIFHNDLVKEVADRVSSRYPGFATDAFVQEIVADLPGLEFMARARRIAKGLHSYLLLPFPDAVAILLESLGEDDGSGGVEGYDSFRYLPFLNFVGMYGLDHPDVALDALAYMTRYFSAEFDIRPFLLHHPQWALSRMKQWSQHPDWRLRRLASEGSRPRLPWGVRLKPFLKDPTLCLEIIDPLYTDPHPVVRRSVANHINDVAKDHPAVAVAVARRWSENGNDATRWIVRHALRTLVKKGDAEALALLGFSGTQPPEAVAFSIMPLQVVLGGSVTFVATLRVLEAANLSIDYAVHYQRQNGSTSPKIFKLCRRHVLTNETIRIEKCHPLRPISTRRHYSGPHRIELLVNGRAICSGTFELTIPASP